MIGSILCFALALHYSFGMDEKAELVQCTVRNVLDNGLRTADIMQPGMQRTSTSEMGGAIVAKLDGVVESDVRA